MKLNNQQLEAIQLIGEFLKNDSFDVFILRGSAGTGKTTLIAELIEKLTASKTSYALLAPTGRAARILASKISKRKKEQMIIVIFFLT